MIYAIPMLSYFVMILIAAGMGRENVPKNMMNIYIAIVVIWYVLYFVHKLYKSRLSTVVVQSPCKR